jgi:glutamyl-tRNA reductase
VEHFKVIAFTHANIGLNEVAKVFVAEDQREKAFAPLKELNLVDEFMYLATCNRVEFYFSTSQTLNNAYLRTFFHAIFPHWDTNELHSFVEHSKVVDGMDAMRHMFNVASSLDSMVVGEREILTQFRQSYERAEKMGLTGDFLRLAVRKTIENAKRVFTETNIASRPVSVVNLAYRELQSAYIPSDARILVVGAGVTNQALLRKLKKQGYSQISIYNRTLSKAQEACKIAGGEAFDLNELSNYSKGFDVLITCTGANQAIIDEHLFSKLLNGEKDRKFVIDLAVPTDIAADVPGKFNFEYVEVKSLKAIAEANLQARKSELVHCERIVDENLDNFKHAYQERLVELAMRDVPQKVKEIKDRAINQVFARDLSKLDDQSKELLDEIIAYMEKKYISVPMKMAREILLDSAKKLPQPK